MGIFVIIHAPTNRTIATDNHGDRFGDLCRGI
jgi:hypothetical protein